MPSLYQSAPLVSALSPMRCLHDYPNGREHTFFKFFQATLPMPCSTSVVFKLILDRHSKFALFFEAF
jgi:hypothetical protein